MKKALQFIFLIVLMILIGCTLDRDVTITVEEDVEFIKSFEGKDRAEYLIKIDSLISHYDGSNRRLALLYLKKGRLLSVNHDFEKAIENLEIALETFEELENKKYITEANWLLGSANAFNSNKISANNHLLVALKGSREIDDKKMEANIYGSLAQVHFLFKDYDRSVGFAKDAIDLHAQLEDTLGLSSMYNNMAIIYKNIESYDSAIAYNRKSLELSVLRSDTIAIAKSHSNMGSLIINLGDDSTAIDHFEKAISIYKENGILNSSPIRSLGEVLRRNGKRNQAKKRYVEALEIERSKGNTSTNVELNNILLQIALEERDFENALVYQNDRDSLVELKTQRDTQEKLALVENQYRLAAEDQELRRIQGLNQKNRWIFIAILGIVILAALAFFQFERNRKVNYEKEKMLLEQKVLRSQMNPHFIFNVLTSIQSSLLDNDPIKSATYLSTFAKLVRQNFEFIDKKSIPLRDELAVLGNYVEAQKFRYKDKFDCKFKVDKDLDIDTTEIPPLLLQPFLENSIEHGFKNISYRGLVTVSVWKENGSIWFEILDNGKGFDVSKRPEGVHAMDILKKRLSLLGDGSEKLMFINSTDKETSIKFAVKHD